jgi:hypothetical protein
MWTLKPIIQKQLESPNLLPPPPDEEQLLRTGPFDFEIATLCEDPELRSGLQILRQPQHTLVAGKTTYGKSVPLKTIIVRLCDAARRAGRFVCILVFDRKGGDFEDLCTLFSRYISRNHCRRLLHRLRFIRLRTVRPPLLHGNPIAGRIHASRQHLHAN